MGTQPFDRVAPPGAPSRRLCGVRSALTAYGGAFRAACRASPTRGPLRLRAPRARAVVPEGRSPAPPECTACSPRPRAPARTPRAGATGSRPSGERAKRN